MACYDVNTLVLIVRVYFHLCPSVFKKSSRVKQAKNTGAELTAQQLELRYSPTSSLLFAGIVWGCSLTETLTSKYVTASRAHHIPECVSYGAFDTLSSLFPLDSTGSNITVLSMPHYQCHINHKQDNQSDTNDSDTCLHGGQLPRFTESCAIQQNYIDPDIPFEQLSRSEPFTSLHCKAAPSYFSAETA